jgi:hypothetical protein
MFERVVLKRSFDGPAISIGEIAEALLFYQSVHIVLDHSSLFGLIECIGIHNTLKLLALPDVKTTYIDEMPATYTEQTSNGPEYALISCMFTGHQDIGIFSSRKKRLEVMLESRGYNKSDAKSFAEKFRKCVNYKKLSDDYFIKGGLIPTARVDLFDNEYVAEASRIVAQNLLGQHSLPNNFFFRVIPNGESFSVATNLDLELISKVQLAKDMNAGQYTPAHVTSELLNASIGLIFAGHYGGDFYTSETESKIIQLRQAYLLRRFQLDRTAINEFHEIILKGSPSIVEVINQKQRSFEEFLELLSSAKKFKNWLKGKSPDESLITGYLEDITAKGWLSSVPGKLLRYVVSSGVGAIEPVSGLAISAGDSFFLDKLFSGWKPNQFIDGKIKHFVDPEGDFD